MLLDEIKARMFRAIKAGHTVEKEILRVAVGEITTEAARPGRQGSDEESFAILRKLIKSNEESMAASESAEQRATLTQEIGVLAEFLPRALGEDEISALLAPVSEAVRAAKNDGQATGIAMKELKSKGANVDGSVVARAVVKLRQA